MKYFWLELVSLIGSKWNLIKSELVAMWEIVGKVRTMEIV